MKKILSFISATLLLMTSCVDMDVAPKNMVTSDQLLSNESGMDIYLARLYSNMPYEDFKYMGQWGFNFSGWLVAMGIEGTGECTNRDGICRAFTGEDTPYWGMAFTQLRDANFMLENLPKYKGNFPEVTYNHYLGEAYYVRATVFYAMAKRFGGVPLVTKVIQYPQESDSLEVPRASEEETWNQVLADFDRAIELLQPTSPKAGYSNKYKALAYKSEAMLYAGSVAKYNQTVSGNLTGTGSKTGVRVIGFAPDRWEAASKKYFTEAASQRSLRAVQEKLEGSRRRRAIPEHGQHVLRQRQPREHRREGIPLPHHHPRIRRIQLAVHIPQPPVVRHVPHRGLL